jgi:Fur family ferric uptake transcriptional regulator
MSQLLSDVLTRLNNYLSSKGLRKTRQRELIVQAIFASEDHCNADELHERAKRLDKSISRASVYRTLSLLVECGLVREVDLGKDQAYYDPNFLDKPDHNHLICLDCDRVVEFEDEHVALMHDCLTRRLGFQPQLKTMRIEAHCDEFARLGLCKFKKDPPV